MRQQGCSKAGDRPKHYHHIEPWHRIKLMTSQPPGREQLIISCVVKETLYWFRSAIAMLPAEFSLSEPQTKSVSRLLFADCMTKNQSCGIGRSDFGVKHTAQISHRPPGLQDLSKRSLKNYGVGTRGILYTCTINMVSPLIQ